MIIKKMNACLMVGAVLLLLNIGSVMGQDAPSKGSWHVGADLMSRYYWRGMALSTSPAIQPCIEYSIGGFTAGAWGSYSFSKEPYQEIDLYLAYEFGNVSLAVYDYFSFTDSLDVSHQYFDWDSHGTAHTLEAILEAWDIFGTPFSLEAGLFLYGDDKNDEGKQYYSAYIEPQYSFSMGDNELMVFAGFSPAEGAYADKFGFVNVGITGCRSLKMSDVFTVPISATFAVNPSSDSVFLVAGLSF
ncbi:MULTISPECIES: hypothetical protein [unclassified Carboxylicivirga]|uniref:hypothetical protein n=1 Tax=Carboxylicivirga TaxID=1628153 RepID=UPI003D3599DD